MIEGNESLNALLWLIVAIVSLIPLSIFTMSYIRLKNRRLLFTTAAFALFFLKAIILFMKVVLPFYADEFWWAVAAMLDISIITLITISLIQKD